MIQDIAPHIYNNAFGARREPREGDYLLLIREERIFLEKDGAGQIAFPRVGSAALQTVPEEEPPHGDEQTEPRGGGRTDAEAGIYRQGVYSLWYLFSIDDTAFYGTIGDTEALETACGPSWSWVPFSELRGAQPNVLAYAGITGAQLARWRKDRKFCGACGARMRASRTERAFECPDCGAVVYPKISPAVIVAVTHGDRLLLTKYAGRAYARYALVAGFAEIGETIEETVHREVLEEVGVRVKNLRFYKSQPWSFSDTLLMGFYCDLDGEDESITLDESELAVGEWFRREDVPERSGDISLTGEMIERFRLGKEPR